MTRKDAHDRATELQANAPADVDDYAFYRGNNYWEVRSRKIIHGQYMPSELIEPKG